MSFFRSATRSFIAIIPFFCQFKSTFAFRQCYFPDGSIPTDYIWEPCINDETKESSCCVPSEGDICQPNGLCLYSLTDDVYRGTCTDRTWNDPACMADICVTGYETTWIWVLQCDSQSGSKYECGTVDGYEHDTATCPRGAKANTASYVTTFPTTTAHRYTPPPTVNAELSTVITQTYTVIITANEQTTTLTSIFASTFTSALPNRIPTTIPKSTSTLSSSVTSSPKTQKSGVTLAPGAIAGIAAGPIVLIAIGAALFYFLRKRSKKNKDAIELLSAGNDNLGTDAPPPNGPVGADQVHPYEFDTTEAKGARLNQHSYRGPKVDTYEVSAGKDATRDEKRWKDQGAGVPEMGADDFRSPRSPVPMYTEHVIPVELDGTSVVSSVRR
ncbi:hypothetical protein F5884DRAFT_83197 [Xylogone sp. PMI_703]|nr:hypothetical protein F5884DRAFT_83197 [Xylogone sp. PMI_703]